MSHPTELTEDEVRQRIEAVRENDGVLDQLYHLGEMLLSDAVARLGAIDSKAVSLAGYAGGIVTLLVATSKIWGESSDEVLVSLTVLAGFLAAAAGAWAVSTLSLRRTEWFTIGSWLQKDCLENRNKLRCSHMLTMWSVIKSHHSHHATKVKRLRTAQRLLVAAGALLTVSFLQVAHSRTPLKYLGLDWWKSVSGCLHRLLG